METITWPELKSCKHQCYEARTRANDRLSQLPHEIIMLIMSLLSTKEVIRTCVLSHTWKDIWRYSTVLNFEANLSPTRRCGWFSLFKKKRSGFTRCVNEVVKAHRGPTIDELRVKFALDSDFKSDINKWLTFSLAKKVKRLKFDFTTQLSYKGRLDYNNYEWPLKCGSSSLDLLQNLVYLKSLSLAYVRVTTKDIEYILLSCHTLENLCIVKGSLLFTSIQLPHTSLQLKHLTLSQCLCLSIDIRVPKLVSFTVHGRPIDQLHLREYSSLSEVSIGNGDYELEIVPSTFSSLSRYVEQLKYLSWDLIFETTYSYKFKVNRGIKNPPTMTNLNHLEFCIQVKGYESLLGWAYLIEASPVLQKLTIHFSKLAYRGDNAVDAYVMNIEKRKGSPLRSLKTLEHFGVVGSRIDIEFANYVVDNSIMLDHVIFSNPEPQSMLHSNYASSRVQQFRSTLPQGVTFQFGMPKNKHSLP